MKKLMFYFTLILVSSAKMQGNTINIYPNPFKNILNIETTLKDQPIYIYNLLGHLVYEAPIKTGISEIDLSNLSNGTYYMRVGISIRKIIKE